MQSNKYPVDTLHFKNNIITKRYKNCLHFTTTELLLSEHIDGLPYTFEDSLSYKFNSTKNDSEIHKSQIKLTGDLSMAPDCGSFPDLELISKTFGLVNDTLDEVATDFADRKALIQLPNIPAEIELASLNRRIKNLEFEQKMELQGNFQTTPTPFNSFTYFEKTSASL